MLYMSLYSIRVVWVCVCLCDRTTTTDTCNECITPTHPHAHTHTQTHTHKTHIPTPHAPTSHTPHTDTHIPAPHVLDTYKQTHRMHTHTARLQYIEQKDHYEHMQSIRCVLRSVISATFERCTNNSIACFELLSLCPKREESHRIETENACG